MPNCDETDERFHVKFRISLNNNPHSFAPQFTSTFANVLNKASQNKGLQMRGDVTIHIIKLITSRTSSIHFHIQSALPTRNVLCYNSDKKLNVPHVG